MGIKPDHWIRKMALEQGMIEPFEPEQVRNGVISYGVSSYGYDIRVADEFKIFTNVFSAIVDPKQFDPRVDGRFSRRGVHHPAQFLCPGAHGRIFPHPAQRADHLRRQKHLRPLRDHRQRDALRAGMGRLCHPGDLQHHPAAGQDLCQ